MMLNPYAFASGVVDTGLIGSYLSGLWGGYSLDLLSSAYTGDCLRLRRSSDNAEQDIGFDTGVIDTAAIASFVSSDSAYVVTWYDQSGGGNHLTQPTTANQPRMVNAGAYLGWAGFDGVNDCLQSVNDGGTPSFVTVFAAGTFRNAAGSTEIYTLGDPQNDRGAQVQTFGGDDMSGAVTGSGGFGGGNSYTREFSNQLPFVRAVLAAVFDPIAIANKVKIYADGVAQSETLVSYPGTVNVAFIPARHKVGARYVDGTLASDMDVETFLIYEADKTVDMVSISAALA